VDIIIPKLSMDNVKICSVTMVSTPPITIIPFQPEDQEVVQDLINAGLGEHWDQVDAAMNPDLFDIAQSYQNETFLIARSGDEIVGTGALVQRTKETAEIVRMSVAANYRRQGIGHQILDQLIQVGHARGFRKIILETTSTWRDVISFYLAYGFTITHYLNGDTYFSYEFNNRSQINGIENPRVFRGGN